MKKIFLLLSTFLLLPVLFSCGGNNYDVYYLNFKPEQDKEFKELVSLYKEETGKTLKVTTAAANQYESTLQSEVLKKEKPTIFTVNGPVGFNNWKNYCLDLSDNSLGYEESVLYDLLLDKSMAITENDKVYGIPVTIEGYGLIYNKKVFNEYFSLPNKASNLNSVEEIKSFNDLKEIVLDLTEYINKTKTSTASMENIGKLKGVFAPVSLSSGAQWPYTTHLANIPFYFEFIEHNEDATIGGLSLNEVEFKYNNEFRNIFDLYIDNSTVSKNKLGDITYDDSVNSFAQGTSAILQQGNWVYSNIRNSGSNAIADEDLGMMPIYTGIGGEAEYSIPVGTENFWCINKNADDSRINESIMFMNWLFTSEKGMDFVTNKLGFISPFSSFSEDVSPDNPLAKEVLRLSSEGKTIAWSFSAFPSENFKNSFGGALLEYAQGRQNWVTLVENVKEFWKKEKKGS